MSSTVTSTGTAAAAGAGAAWWAGAASTGALLGKPALVETLRAYLHSGPSTRATAAALRIHENTVTYRLRQITEALGTDGTAALVRADILMALRFQELNGSGTTA